MLATSDFNIDEVNLVPSGGLRDAPQQDQGKLSEIVRRVGNSFEFWLFINDSLLDMSSYRVVAREVSSDPHQYSDAFLGMSNMAYCSWIMNRSNW